MNKTGIIQLENLDFEMRNGLCVTYSEDYVLLCASYSDPVGCQSFDGEKVTFARFVKPTLKSAPVPVLR